ncbi:hypothetical protein VHEMI07446 [[Torrubiella] hemipterigena]|uniref:LysM domain-containing protein n=1 Tax=[Torrubiella] hemipterigena TaxID=1531966 RepID=A0A0A1TAF9_9HYPO|nr:hypothetical protein VHEMI07446 [[Torrubiella] hemipterigena]
MPRASSLAVLALAGSAQAVCSFRWKASEGSSCRSMANDWGVPVNNFIKWNQKEVGPDCSRGVNVGGLYCVEWSDDQKPGQPQVEAHKPHPAAQQAQQQTEHHATAADAAHQQEPFHATADEAAHQREQPHAAAQKAQQQAAQAQPAQPQVQQYQQQAEHAQYQQPEQQLPVPQQQQQQFQPPTTMVAVVKQPYVGSTPPTVGGSPSPVQQGIANNCQRFYRAQRGETCQQIADKFGNSFSVPDFENWNPAVHSDCSALLADYYYCVSTSGSTPVNGGSPSSAVQTPQPIHADTASNCNRFYRADRGDSCDSIVDKYRGFTVADFQAWNPSVKPDCTGIIANDYYCVGTESYRSTPAVNIRPSGADSSAAEPARAAAIQHMPDQPARAAVVNNQHGQAAHPAVFDAQRAQPAHAAVFDAQRAVPASFNPAAENFYYPNNGAHAVPIPGPVQEGVTTACQQFYRVQNNDICNKIVADFGNRFTVSEFIAWNPSAKSDCSGLWAGYYVCVKA